MHANIFSIEEQRLTIEGEQRIGQFSSEAVSPKDKTFKPPILIQDVVGVAQSQFRISGAAAKAQIMP